eukprot:6172821-Pleurochrysis_carterae.AAC.3
MPRLDGVPYISMGRKSVSYGPQALHTSVPAYMSIAGDIRMQGKRNTFYQSQGSGRTCLMEDTAYVRTARTCERDTRNLLRARTMSPAVGSLSSVVVHPPTIP